MPSRNFFPKVSAQPLPTDLHNILLYLQIHLFITVLQTMARVDPMTTLLSLTVGGCMQSQVEAELASMNLKVQHTRLLLRPRPQHQRHEPPVSRPCFGSSFLSPYFADTVDNPVMPPRRSLNNAPNSKLPITPPIVHLAQP